MMGSKKGEMDMSPFWLPVIKEEMKRIQENGSQS
jgi:hypothetical protein